MDNIFSSVSAEQYEAEAKKNIKILQTGLKKFIEIVDDSDFFSKYTNLLNKELINKKRLTKLIYSLTDDLMRYSAYHAIKSNNYHYKHRKEDLTFSICEPVRASFFTKWIMTYKPLKLCDFYNYPDIKLTKNQIQLVSLANEHLALCIASVILNIHDESNKKICIYDIMPQNEFSVIIYSLTHRIKHQDSYTMFFYRLSDFRG